MELSKLKIISAFITIMFNYMLFNYLDRIEKCTCAKEYYGLKISKSLILVNYLIIFGMLFVPEIPKTTAIFLTFYNITVAVSTFVYMKFLRDSNCKCSDSIVRDFYYYYYLILFILDLVLISMFTLIMLTKIV